MRRVADLGWQLHPSARGHRSRLKLFLLIALARGGSACCSSGNVSIGPCEWKCGVGCNFHPDFTVSAGCTGASLEGSCRPGWERAVCSCTNPCPLSSLAREAAPPLSRSPTLLLRESEQPARNMRRPQEICDIVSSCGECDDFDCDASCYCRLGC